MKRILPLVAVLLFAPPEFTTDFRFAGLVRGGEPVEAFLEKHCVRCHGPEKKKGDLRIDQLSRDFKLGRGRASLGGGDRTGQLPARCRRRRN